MANFDRRIRSLDSLLLFLATIFGLLFSLLYILLGYREIVYGFFPMLILGLVIPIYVGYVRGAILLDTLEERVRGWVYFINGSVAYLAVAIMLVITRLLVELNIEFTPFFGLPLMVCSFLIGFFLGGGKLRRWFCRNIFDAFNHKMTKLTNEIYIETGITALYIGIFFVLAFGFSITRILNFSLLSMVLIISGLVYFAIKERDIRRLVSLVRFSEYIEVESRGTKSYIPSQINKPSAVISIVALTLLLMPFWWSVLPIQLGLVVVLVTSIILFLLSAEKWHTFVKKKGVVPVDVEIELTRLLNRINGIQEE